MDDVDYTSEQLMDDAPEPLGNDADFPPKSIAPLPLSHYDQAGEAHMVDVSEKTATRREAVAAAFVELSDEVLRALPQNPKGNPLEVARFAGIQAAKKTSELIPMCHQLALSFVDVRAEVVDGGVEFHEEFLRVDGAGQLPDCPTHRALAQRRER